MCVCVCVISDICIRSNTKNVIYDEMIIAFVCTSCKIIMLSSWILWDIYKVCHVECYPAFSLKETCNALRETLCIIDAIISPHGDSIVSFNCLRHLKLITFMKLFQEHYGMYGVFRLNYWLLLLAFSSPLRLLFCTVFST